MKNDQRVTFAFSQESRTVGGENLHCSRPSNTIAQTQEDPCFSKKASLQGERKHSTSQETFIGDKEITAETELGSLPAIHLTK